MTMADAELNRLLNLKSRGTERGWRRTSRCWYWLFLDLVEVGLVGADGLIHKDAELGL